MTDADLHPENILVIQLARFGDFLQTTPLLAALKARYPHSELTVLVTANQAELARTNPNLDAVLTVDLGNLAEIAQRRTLLSEKFKELSTAVKGLKALEYDLLINLNTSRVAALLGHLIPAKKRQGSHFGRDRRRLLTAPWTRFIMHLMAHRRLIRFNLVDLLTTYAGHGVPPSAGLTYPLTSETARLASDLLGPGLNGPLLGIQLGSRHKSRQWPVENYACLGQKLIMEQGAHLVLLGTNEERSLGQDFMARLGRTAPQARIRVIDLMGRTSVPGLAGVLDRLDLLITSDTGSMHLAAALKTPILALFMGPALCHETGPCGPGHLIAQVVTDCSPCTEDESRCSEMVCRFMIKPSLVFSLARYLLSQKASDLPGREMLGSNVRILVSEMDDFGTIYRPLIPWPLDREEILALAFREAGRSFMRAGYRVQEEKLGSEFMNFEPSELPGLGNLVRRLVELEEFLPLRKDRGPVTDIIKIGTEEPELKPLIRTLLIPEVSPKTAQGMVQNMRAVISKALSYSSSRVDTGRQSCLFQKAMG